MSKTKEDLVKSTIDLQENMNSLSQDKVNEMAPKPDIDEKPQLSLKEKARLANAVFIEPIRKLTPFGKLPDSLKKEHAYDWEYVTGIFENVIINGEPLRFWYSKYPGDPDCLWEIPCNKPLYLPRMIAKHLEEGLKYHTFTYREIPQERQRPDEFTHEFIPTGTHYRGKMRAVDSFR